MDELINPPEPDMITCYDCAGEGHTISLDFDTLEQEELFCETCYGTGQVEKNKYTLNQLKFEHYED